MKKKLNIKGMTIIEIILAIGLVSIVMVQVLNLLVDLKSEQTLGESKTKDLSNRSIIMQRIEKDFVNKNIIGMEECPLNAKISGREVYVMKSCVKITYEDDTSKPSFIITAYNKDNKYDYFIYGFAETASAEIPDVYEAWRLESGKYPESSCGYQLLAFYCNTECNSNYFILKYPVLLSESVSNTTLNFDIELIYYFRNGATLPADFDKVGDASDTTTFWSQHHNSCK